VTVTGTKKMTMRFVRTVSIIFLFVLLGCTEAVAGQEAAIATSKPDVAAATFYKWYLNELAQNHDPLSGGTKCLAPYVSASLLRQITRMMHSPDGMEADYFIQAQDYLDGWLHHVSTSDTKVQAGVATTIVTLGEKPEEQYRLFVTLVREAGVWKIRRVKRVPAIATKTP
jgi:Protein of unknown function (DUF3828)